MPRPSPDGVPPTWGRLYEVAAPQAGYLTLAQATAAGYSSPLVEYHVRTGHLERVGRGIFRLAHFPPTDNEDLVIFWLWSRQTGVFSHETALALHQLSDALPAKVHMTASRDWQRRRLRVPRGLVLHFGDVGTDDLTWLGPIPLTTPLRTVVDVVFDGDPALGQQASAQAVKRKLFSRVQLQQAIRNRRTDGSTR